MTAYRFVEREKTSFPVTTMCRVLGVSPSGYWAWSRRPPSARARSDAELTATIRAIHRDSRGVYGTAARRASRDQAHRSLELAHPGRRAAGRVRLHRRLLQPAPSSFRPRLSESRRVREEVPYRDHERRLSMEQIHRPRKRVNSN